MARKATATITKTCTRTGFTITGTPDEVAEHFYRDSSAKDGFSPWTKDAERTYNKAYRAGLKEAGVPRVKDADEAGVSTFDSVMHREGVRTPRGSKKVVAVKRTARKRATSPRASAKKATTTRRTARKVKATARKVA
jgi:hypothetical protein